MPSRFCAAWNSQSQRVSNVDATRDRGGSRVLLRPRQNGERPCSVRRATHGGAWVAPPESDLSNRGGGLAAGASRPGFQWLRGILGRRPLRRRAAIHPRPCCRGAGSPCTGRVTRTSPAGTGTSPCWDRVEAPPAQRAALRCPGTSACRRHRPSCRRTPRATGRARRRAPPQGRERRRVDRSPAAARLCRRRDVHPGFFEQSRLVGGGGGEGTVSGDLLGSGFGREALPR